MTENKTINIPVWVAQDPNLSWSEKALYSVYHFFTFFGGYQACTLTNEELGKRLGLKERTIQRTKQKLVDLGYITFDGGIRVVANYRDGVRGVKSGTGGVKNGKRGTKNDTHNREDKELNKESNTYIISTYSYKCQKPEIEEPVGEGLISSSTLEEEISTYPKGTEGLEPQITEQQYIPIEQELDTATYLKRRFTEELGLTYIPTVEYVGDAERDVVLHTIYLGVPDATPLERLRIAYRDGYTDELPLLSFFKDKPTEEVHNALVECLSDKALAVLPTFCKNIGFIPKSI